MGTASESGLGIGAAAAGGVGIAAAAGGAAAAAAAGAAAAAAGAVVSGGVVAGKLVASHGLKVELYKADGVTLIATGAIDASGNYSVDIGSYRGIVITKIVDTSAGADFIDEATGKAVDLNGTLMSIGVVAGSTKMNVNPLTTVAAKKAGATNGATTGAPSDSDVAKYNASIAESFGLTDLIGIDVVTTQDGGYNPNNGVSAAEKLGAILAALSGMDQTAGAGNIDTAIDALANGITVNLVSSDGTLSGNVANLLLAGAKTADPNTSGSLTNLISDAVAQTNASVSINAIGSDNAIDATESAGGVTITGTTVTGATVALSIGGV